MDNNRMKLKSLFWSKTEILDKKNKNFGEKQKFWSKTEILVKHRNFTQKQNFGQKQKVW